MFIIELIVMYVNDMIYVSLYSISRVTRNGNEEFHFGKHMDGILIDA